MVEMLVSTLVALLVIVVPMTWFIVSIRQANVASSRALSSTQAEVGLAQLTRDVREISFATTPTFTWGVSSASATFSVPTSQGQSTQLITWTCAFGNSGTCTRQVASGPHAIEIRNVTSLAFAPTDANGNALSSPASNPAYVGITLKVQNTSSLDRTSSNPVFGTARAITLADGAYLRNTQ
jgi:Tfp pilus assembly protein PilW